MPSAEEEFLTYVRQWLYTYHAYRLPMLEYWLQPFARLVLWLLVALVLSGAISLWLVAQTLFSQSKTFTWVVWAAATLLFMSGVVVGLRAYAIGMKKRQSQRAHERSERDISCLPFLDCTSRGALIRLMNLTHCRVSRAQFRQELAEVERDAPVLFEWQCLQHLRRLACFGTRKRL
ncbi:hypothetical protein HYW68_02785 [Candidatus Parcubacteria bacterium]|nr:hypothetical protein [Candidatus Parcubacteria bacterium]